MDTAFGTDLSTAARLLRSRPALLTFDGEIPDLSYSALPDYLRGAGATLTAVAQGGPVATLLPDRPETFRLILSAFHSGVSIAPLHFESTQSDIEAWDETVRPSAWIVAPERTADVVDARCDSERVVTPSELAALDGDQSGSSGPAHLFIRSSGTTGEPKAIMWDQESLWRAACSYAALVDVESTGGTRAWNFLPLSYLGGILNLGLVPLAMGAAIIDGRSLAPAAMLDFWRTVQEHEVSFLWLSPTLAGMLLRLRGARGAFRHSDRRPICMVGMAAVDDSLKDAWFETTGAQLCESYGLSETTFISSQRITVSGVEGRGAGKPLPYAEVRAGREAAAPIAVKSMFNAVGYVQHGDVAPLEVDADGFWDTGDLGVIDNDGHLIVTGRTKDVIKRGGYLIGLAEADSLARDVGGVSDAVSVAQPHPHLGEVYVVYVELQAGAQVRGTEDRVMAHLADVLPRYRLPERVVAVPELDRTASGKTIRRRPTDSHAPA